MGGYSSGSDDNYSRKVKKKKKKRSRSRSRSHSDSGESSRSRRSKHKKSKKGRHRRRSRSYSAERRRPRSRSRSRDRRSRSRSGSRGRDRRDRRRSRSRSHSRYHSRSRSGSRSRSRDRSRRKSRSRSPKNSGHQTGKGKSEIDPCVNVPGFSEMTPAQKAEIRMSMALRAAAAADEKLKEQGLLPQGVGRTADSLNLTAQEQQQRAKAIEDVESEGFAPVTFKSGRGQDSSSKLTSHPMTDVNHEAAMFGFTSLPTQTKGIKYKETDNFVHPSLYVNTEEKMEQWRRKLVAYRKQKLEGEAMS